MDKCRKCVKTFFLFVRICLLSFSLKPFLVILWPISIEAISLFAYANFGDLASIWFSSWTQCLIWYKMQSIIDMIQNATMECYNWLHFHRIRMLWYKFKKSFSTETNTTFLTSYASKNLLKGNSCSFLIGLLFIFCLTWQELWYTIKTFSITLDKRN